MHDKDPSFIGNCLPCLHIEQKSKHISTYCLWMGNSAKQYYLSDMDVDAIISAASQTEVLARPSKARKVQNDEPSDRSLIQDDLQPTDELTEDPTDEFLIAKDMSGFNPLESVASFLRVFEAELLLRGRVWLLEETDQILVVLWNACSSEDCKILRTSWSTTTFYKDDMLHHSQAACADCPIFKSSSDQQRVQISCPHLMLRGKVLNAAQSVNSVMSSAFESFLRDSFDASSPVLELLRSELKSQYLVLCPKIQAHQVGLITRHGMVTIETSRRSGETLLSCGNTHCKRRIDRKPAKRPENFCPHFETLWKCSTIMSELRSTMKSGFLHSDSQVQSDSDSGSGSENEEDEPLAHDRELVLEEAALNGDQDDDHDDLWKTSVKFNLITGRWDPDTSGSFAAIPLHPTDHTRRWAESRARGVDLLTDATGFLQWTDGELQGLKPCVPEHPDNCLSCGSTSFDLVSERSILIRTYLGCVRRSRHSLQCTNQSSTPKLLSLSRNLIQFCLHSM